jgi:hypothetical protein
LLNLQLQQNMKRYTIENTPRIALNPRMRSVVGALALLLNGAAIQARAGYSISWFKIAAGGGTSTNQLYSLSGTLGQHDAGGPMAGGGFTLNGGFWALYAVQTPGAPLLTITRSGANVIPSWPISATGYVLQQCTDIASGVWTDVNLTPVDNGSTRSVTLPVLPGNRFFRLRK